MSGYRNNTMQAYLINLARRADRLAAMTAQFARLGLEFTPVEALDARAQPQEAVDKWFAATGPLGALPLGDKCCTLSHRRAWEMFVASGEAHAAIFEDDIILTPQAASLLRDDGWIAPGVGLVKLEQYGPPAQRVLVGGACTVRPGYQIARLYSRHTGAAAYIISRETAQMLLERVRLYALPVDHLLFNPNNSPHFAALAPWQLIPAIARQQEFVGEKSDIEGWRISMRKWSWTYIRRELIRAGYELKLVPRQVTSLMAGKTRLIRIAAAPLSSRTPDC
jgi:glycosyl transferase family 25